MKQTTIFSLLAVLVLSGTMTLQAQRGPDRGQRMMEQLDLTDEQAETLKDLRTDHMKLMADHQADIKKASIDLRSLMAEDEPDKTAIKAKMKEIADLRLAAAEARVDQRFSMSEVLTPEQQKKWKELRGERFRDRDGRQFRRQGRMEMRRHMRPDGGHMQFRQRLHR